jgi:hypothetical protein
MPVTVDSAAAASLAARTLRAVAQNRNVSPSDEAAAQREMHMTAGVLDRLSELYSACLKQSAENSVRLARVAGRAACNLRDVAGALEEEV